VFGAGKKGGKESYQTGNMEGGRRTARGVNKQASWPVGRKGQPDTAVSETARKTNQKPKGSAVNGQNKGGPEKKEEKYLLESPKEGGEAFNRERFDRR